MAHRRNAFPRRIGRLALGLALLTTPLVTPVVAALPKPAAVVTMSNELHFTPSPVTVHVGQTVEWRNDSDLVHTVTADPSVAAKRADVALPAGAKPFSSDLLQPGAAYEHTFKVAGTYRYFCIPHEAAGMVGEVIVK